MKKKRVKKLILLVVAIITIVSLGGLFAYLSDTDQKTNIFTLGKIDIELTETNWNSSNAQNVLPGDTINKNPAIKNTGKNPAYVYIKVVNPIVTLSSEEGVLFNYTINSGWTQLDEIEQCGYRATTYYYNNALNPNNSTNALFNSVTINDFSGEINEEQLLDIYGYGIQSTYLENGTTIQSIFSDAFTTGLSDTDEMCGNNVTDCDSNKLYTTAPSNLKGLAKIMAEDAYLDNGKSEFVSSCNGVSFSDISSDTNGKGIYEIASTKNDTYPIYYYRGAVDNNNVKFGGFCWKAIRTTDTGGVKMIYNGEPDGGGNCTNTTGTSTQIGTYYYNSKNETPIYSGYMYGKKYTYFSKSSSELSTSYVYGNDVTYSGGEYTLINTMTSTGTWSNDYNTLNNNHYTCFNTNGSCTSVYFIYYAGGTKAIYITLSDGKVIENIINDMFNGSDVNLTESTAKIQLDNWYNNNLSSYTNYIEDTIYCNDRSICTLGGFDPNGDLSKYLSYGIICRKYQPTLDCSRRLDSFTVSSSNGNGKLTYPVGLITADEIMYAGGKNITSNNTYYLNTNQEYWANTPGDFNSQTGYGARVTTNSSSGISSKFSDTSLGLRPVISLKSSDIVESGDGTATNPYVIQTN